MPFAENTYVAWRDGGTEAMVIDPGTEPEAILAFLSDQGLTPAAILNTHGHADHIAGQRRPQGRVPGGAAHHRSR